MSKDDVHGLWMKEEQKRGLEKQCYKNIGVLAAGK